jgi:hypothetical protein
MLRNCTLASSSPKTGIKIGTSLSLSAYASLAALLCDALRESLEERASLIDH